MITPPRRTLDNLVALNLVFIGDDNTGQQFLANRLCVSPTVDGCVAPGLIPNSDTARLQNIVGFLAYIKEALRNMNNEWWSSINPISIRRERQALSEARYTQEYRDGYGLFDQKGDRASPAFIPAAQQDIIILTLEILARGSVVNAATLQREAFRDVYMGLEQEVMTQAPRQTQVQAPHVLLESREVLELDTLALTQVPVVDAGFIEMIRRSLGPVLLQLGLSGSQNVTPYADHTSSTQIQMPVPPIVTAPSTDILISPDPMPSSAGPATVGGLGDSHV
ncbi:hypothetical protein V8E53_011609 [Lactarius tabidus]